MYIDTHIDIYIYIYIYIYIHTYLDTCKHVIFNLYSEKRFGTSACCRRVWILPCLPHPTLAFPGLARGYREFRDTAVFFDRNRNTCEDVTATTNALDFMLRVGPLSCQDSFRTNVTMQKGDCSDDKQVTSKVKMEKYELMKCLIRVFLFKQTKHCRH